MPNIKYTTPNGRLTFEFTVQGTKQTFENLAEIQQVFEHEKCGKCGSTLIRCNVRKPKNKQGVPVKYFELICQACDARLDVHQNAPPAETLYVTREDADGNDLPDGGWYIWDGQQQQPQQQHPAANRGQQPQQTQSAPASTGGQHGRQPPSDDERKFRELLDRKGIPYGEAVNRINRNHKERYAANISFGGIKREYIIGFVRWLNEQPDAVSPPMDSEGDIPF